MGPRRNARACLPMRKTVRGSISRVLYASKDGGDHSSGMPVAEHLMQPTRTTTRKQGHVPSLFGLAPGGVYPAMAVTDHAVRSYRTLSPLPRAPRGRGGLLSVALSLKSPPPDVIRRRVFVEPGLSSPEPCRNKAQRQSPDPLTENRNTPIIRHGQGCLERLGVNRLPAVGAQSRGAGHWAKPAARLR
jgi:hypothetical protein